MWLHKTQYSSEIELNQLELTSKADDIQWRHSTDMADNRQSRYNAKRKKKKEKKRRKMHKITGVAAAICTVDAHW